MAPVHEASGLQSRPRRQTPLQAPWARTALAMAILAVAYLVTGIVPSLTGRGAAGERRASQARLPFGGQFPLAAITGSTFRSTLGGLDQASAVGGERPYGVFLLMNAMAPEYVCFQCRAFEKAFRRAAALFPAEERLERGVHFATLDLKDNRSLFVEAKVQDVPTLAYLFPHNAEPAVLFNAQLEPSHREFRAFIRRTAGFDIGPPARHSRRRMLFIAAGLAIILLNVGYRFRAAIARAAAEGRVLGAACVVFITAMCSGVMFVRIRESPAAFVTKRGSVQYFAGGVQSQYGVEAQAIMALGLLTSTSVILLATHLPKAKSGLWRRLATYACCATLLVSFGWQMAMLKFKLDGKYPFHLVF